MMVPSTLPARTEHAIGQLTLMPRHTRKMLNRTHADPKRGACSDSGTTATGLQIDTRTCVAATIGFSKIKPQSCELVTRVRLSFHQKNNFVGRKARGPVSCLFSSCTDTARRGFQVAKWRSEPSTRKRRFMQI